MSHETTWLLKLRESVSSPLRKLNEVFGYSQKKLQAVASTTGQMSKNLGIVNPMIKSTTGSLASMQSQLKKLEELQSKAFNPKHVQNYEKSIRKLKGDIANWRKTNGIDVKPKLDWQTASAEIPGLDRLMGLAKNPLAIGAVATVAIGKGAYEATKLSADWEAGMAKVNATAMLGQKALDDLDTKLQNIGENSGGNFERVPEAFEKILSVNGDVNESLAILKTSLRGSIAGFTDLDVVGRSIATTMSIIGKGRASTQEVLDTYLKAKRIGAGEFGDFANYMPGLIASGRVLNMNWKQTAGIFSYMTQKTRDAADSTMLMKNLFTAFSKKDVLAGLKAAKIQVFDARGEMRRIDEILIDLDKKLGLKSTKAKLKFFDNIGLHDAQAKEALETMLADTKTLKTQIDGVNNSLGETNRQLKATTHTKSAWKELGDAMSGFAKDIGDLFLPVTEKWAKDMTNFFRAFKKESWMQGWNYEFSEKKKNIDGRMMDIAKNWAQNSLYEIKQKQKIGIADVPKEFRTNNAKADIENYKNKLNAEKGAELFNTKLNELKEARKKYTIQDMAFVSDGSKHGGKKAIKFEDFLDQLSEHKNAQPFKPLEKLEAKKPVEVGEDFEKKTKEGNGGLKTLIQNLYITNHNQLNTGSDREKMKRELTDDIVDAGRDGLTTLGI